MATVLVVDDDAMVRAFLTDAFIELGLEVRTAKGAPEALELIEQGLHFDLLVADMLMAEGEMTGDKLIAALRDRGCRQPMYLLTGLVNAPVCEAADGVLLKPPRFAALESVAAGVR